MAKVVLVKMLSGLNLAVRQLSAELRRAGHEVRIVFFKHYAIRPISAQSGYDTAELPALTRYNRGETWNFNMFRPVTDRERQLLVEELEAFRADLVGFSMPTMCMPMAADLSRHVREHTDVPIVWGGQGPTLEPERAIRYADVVCINEGEEVIVELATRAERGEPLAGVAGTWARERSGRILRGERRSLISLDRIAIPDAEPADTVEIENNKVTRNYSPYNAFGQYDIMTQRGCPFSCSFCIESKYQEMFGKKGSLRRRSVDLVIDELKAVKDKFSLKGVMFWDDVFTIDRRWLRSFAPRYAKEIGLPFWCYTYPTTTRREDINLLRDAGCVSMTMGIQSGSQRVLNEVFNRPTPLRRAIEAAEIVMDAGIFLYFDLITRVPYETEQDLEDTFEFLLKLPAGIRMCSLAHMRAYPGYRYTHELQKAEQQFQVEDATYDFYERLFFLAVSDLPTSVKRAIAADPRYRKDPELLTGILPQELDFNYLMTDDALPLHLAVTRRMANAEVADDTLPEAPRRSTRRLPLIS